MVLRSMYVVGVQVSGEYAMLQLSANNTGIT